MSKVVGKLSSARRQLGLARAGERIADMRSVTFAPNKDVSSA
jgi:hypothetical protein